MIARETDLSDGRQGAGSARFGRSGFPGSSPDPDTEAALPIGLRGDHA